MKFSRRWLFLILLAPILIGVWRLRFDVQILNLLPPDLKVVQGLKLYQENFSNNRELILSLRAEDAPAADAAAEILAKEFRAQTNLIDTVRWQPVWFEDPTLSSELLGYIWFNQSPEDFRQLASRLAETNLASVLEATKEKLASSFSPGDIARSAYDPYSLSELPASATAQIPASMRDQNWFASEDGTYRVMFLQARPTLSDYNECIDWVNAVQRVVNSSKEKNLALKNVTVHFTGPPAFVAEASQGMRRDLTESVLGTMVLIGLLFWLAYRSWIPLLWILTLLTLIVGGALALGGFFLGTLNVVSLGFAGILLGVTVDYSLVLYQAALANPGQQAKEIRRKVGAGILWSALTTAGAFLILRTSGFPGLGQLGTLVAIGITLGVITMLTFFLTPLKLAGKNFRIPNLPTFTSKPAFAIGCTAAVTLFIAAGWIYKLPAVDSTGKALEPENSAAYAALKEMEKELNRSEEPYLLLTRGTNEQEVLQRLNLLTPALTNAVAQKQIASFMLPTLLWPRAEAQLANRETARLLAERAPILRNAALTNGFSTNALVLSDALLAMWKNVAESKKLFWPTNELSQWILQKIVARKTNEILALGVVYPRSQTNTPADWNWTRTLPQEETWLTGWQPLAGELLRTMTTKIIWMLAGVLALLAISLWLAFRRGKEVWLSFFMLAFSGLFLCAVMQIFGWSWNLLNIMAVPLLLGSAVDYTILMQLAMRRHRGNVPAVHREIGMALILSAATTAVGFGSLAWASNAGLASLGRVCAAGICCAGITAVFLLPFWWLFFSTAEKENSVSSDSSSISPPSIYSATCWRMAVVAARWIPAKILYATAETALTIYWLTQKKRRDIVTQNLLPAFNGDLSKAKTASRKLFQNFGNKLVDLWRCEAGFPASKLLCELRGADILSAAQTRKNGVLFITPHIGNWELGGYVLAERGMKLHVVTLVEPGHGLTELRQQSRSRSGIETIVIGSDLFAFVEIIKLLQEGATIALLIDRPPDTAATTVELFGKPFRAALAAAELARASGCALVPGWLPKTENGYIVEMLPEISYDRAALGDRQARQQLTQQILRAFEPAIREYADQWYHFVPVWPGDAKAQIQTQPSAATNLQTVK